MNRGMTAAAITAAICVAATGVAAGASGDPDAGFGTAGKATATPAGPSTDDRGTAIGEQNDGSVIVAGTTDALAAGHHDVAVSRLTPAGALDTTFGTGGRTVTAVVPSGNSSATALEVLSDDKILVAGQANGGDQYVARYLANGALDTTFNSPNGFRVYDHGTGETVSDLAIQNDGKIVGAGQVTQMPPMAQQRFSVFRISADGAPDNTFDGDGWEQVQLSFGVAESIAIQPDQKIVVGGTVNLGHQVAAARLDTNGALDTNGGLTPGDGGFGTGGNGSVAVNTNGPVANGAAMTLQPDGKILLAGHGADPRDVVIERVTAAGVADPSWAEISIVSIPIGADISRFDAMTARPDGGVILQGSTTGGDPFVVMRRANGSAVTNYGAHGVRVVDFPGTNLLQGAMLAPDGSTLFAGSTQAGPAAPPGPPPPGPYDFSAYRLEPVLETTPPDTVITNTLDSAVLGPTGKGIASFTGTDPAAPSGPSLPLHFECSVDFQDFAPCVSPQTFLLPTGQHDLAVRAVDGAGNTDPSPATATFVVVKPAPAITPPVKKHKKKKKKKRKKKKRKAKNRRS